MAPQRGPKMSLKSIKMGFKIEVDFCVDFLSIFHGFYLPKTIENETRKRYKTYSKSMSISKAFLKYFGDKTLCANIFAEESQHQRNTVKTDTKSTFSKNAQSKKWTKI